MNDHGGGKVFQGLISDAVGIFLVPVVYGVFEGAEGKGFQRFDAKVVSYSPDSDDALKQKLLSKTRLEIETCLSVRSIRCR